MVKLRALYFSQITHELRTPLLSILALVDKVKPYVQNEKGQKYLKIIKSSTIHLENLVNDVLDMSRIENGKF